MNFSKPYHYLTFTKSPGLRLTEIKLESLKHLIKVDEGDELTFKLMTLFNDETLDIKNCLFEFEAFNNTTHPIQIINYTVYIFRFFTTSGFPTNQLLPSTTAR